MAQFEFSGIDELIRGFEEHGRDMSERLPEAALAGAKAAVSEMEKRVPVRTGGLKGHIKTGDVQRSVADGCYAEVFPSGTKKNGRKRERYETVGYVLEYGRSNMPARPWMRPAVEEGADAIGEAMAEVLTKE